MFIALKKENGKLLQLIVELDQPFQKFYLPLMDSQIVIII